LTVVKKRLPGTTFPCPADEPKRACPKSMPKPSVPRRQALTLGPTICAFRAVLHGCVRALYSLPGLRRALPDVHNLLSVSPLVVRMRTSQALCLTSLLFVLVLAIHAMREKSIQCPAKTAQNSLTGPSPAKPGPLQLPFFAHCLRDPPWTLKSTQARGAVHLGAMRK